MRHTCRWQGEWQRDADEEDAAVAPVASHGWECPAVMSHSLRVPLHLPLTPPNRWVGVETLSRTQLA